MRTIDPSQVAGPVPSAVVAKTVRVIDPSDIADTSAPAAPPLKGSISATPGGIRSWLDSLEGNLRHGGTATLPGRVLGRLQGRGDKGFSGLESGEGKGVADIVGSLPLGAVKMAQGTAEIPSHPVKGTLKAASGALEAATIPLAFAGSGAAKEAIEAIPSSKWAGQMLESVAKDANRVPVNLSRSAGPILQVRSFADRGTSMPQAIGKLLNRATQPGRNQMTYEEARDFYTNITRLSADEMGRLSPPMRRLVGMTANALKQDIGAAAAQVGRMGDYYAAMRDYARALQMKRQALWMVKNVGIPAAKAAGLGAAADVGWKLAHAK